MVEEEPKHLRVLIANERRDRLELLAQVVAGSVMTSSRARSTSRR
jgi:hypothetical protein